MTVVACQDLMAEQPRDSLGAAGPHHQQHQQHLQHLQHLVPPPKRSRRADAPWAGSPAPPSPGHASPAPQPGTSAVAPSDLAGGGPSGGAEAWSCGGAGASGSEATAGGAGALASGLLSMLTAAAAAAAARGGPSTQGLAFPPPPAPSSGEAAAVGDVVAAVQAVAAQGHGFSTEGRRAVAAAAAAAAEAIVAAASAVAYSAGGQGAPSGAGEGLGSVFAPTTTRLDAGMPPSNPPADPMSNRPPWDLQQSSGMQPGPYGHHSEPQAGSFPDANQAGQAPEQHVSQQRPQQALGPPGGGPLSPSLQSLLALLGGQDGAVQRALGTALRQQQGAAEGQRGDEAVAAASSGQLHGGPDQGWGAPPQQQQVQYPPLLPPFPAALGTAGGSVTRGRLGDAEEGAGQASFWLQDAPLELHPTPASFSNAGPPAFPTSDRSHPGLPALAAQEFGGPATGRPPKREMSQSQAPVPSQWEAPLSSSPPYTAPHPPQGAAAPPGSAGGGGERVRTPAQNCVPQRPSNAPAWGQGAGALAGTEGEARQPESQPQAQSQRYRGVRQRRWGRWVTEIREPVRGQRIWLGSYSNPEEAARVYDMAARLLRGRAARLNFPGEKVAPVALPRSTAEALLRASREAAGKMHGPPGSDKGQAGAAEDDAQRMQSLGITVLPSENAEREGGGGSDYEADGTGSPCPSGGTPAPLTRSPSPLV